MVNRRSVVAGAIGLVSVIALAACNPAANREGSQAPDDGGSSFGTEVAGTLKISGFNPSDEVGQSRADFAKTQLSGLTVQLDTTSFDAQKFAAQAASGNVADLIQVDRSVVATLADKDLIIPLDDCYAGRDVTPDQQYYASAIADVSYDGKVFAVPQFFQPAALLADTRVLAKAGVDPAQVDTSDPDALIGVGEKLNARSGRKPTVIGFDPDLPGSAYIWFTVFGGRTNDEKGRPTLDEEANVEALGWLKRLMDAQGGYASIKSFKDSMDVFGDKNQYVADQVGVQTWAQWYVNVLAGTADEVDITAIPIKNRDGKALAMAGGTAFAVPKAGKNPAAACAWALTATSTDAWLAAGKARAATVAEEGSINTGLFTGSPVADQAVREQFVKPSGDADFDQAIQTYYAILPDNQTRGASAVGQQIDQDLSNAVAVTMAGEKDPQTALADAQASALRAWDQSKAGQR